VHQQVQLRELRVDVLAEAPELDAVGYPQPFGESV